MITAMVKVEPIFHIISVMINPMPSPAGAMIIQDISISSTEVSLTTETVVGMMMTTAVITITLTVEIIISGLPITLYLYKTPTPKFSMAILGISHYNTISSRQYSIQT